MLEDSVPLRALLTVEREEKAGAVTLHNAILSIQEANFNNEKIAAIQNKYKLPECYNYDLAICEGWEKERRNIAIRHALGQSALLLHNAIIDEKDCLTFRGRNNRGKATPKNTAGVWMSILNTLNNYIDFPNLCLDGIYRHIDLCKERGADPKEIPYWIDGRPLFFGTESIGLPNSYLTAQNIVCLDIKQLGQCLDAHGIKHGLAQSTSRIVTTSVREMAEKLDVPESTLKTFIKTPGCPVRKEGKTYTCASQGDFDQWKTVRDGVIKAQQADRGSKQGKKNKQNDIAE